MADHHHIPMHHDIPMHHEPPIHHEPPVHHEPAQDHDHSGHHHQGHSGHDSHHHNHGSHDHGHGHEHKNHKHHGQNHGRHGHHSHGDAGGSGQDAGAQSHGHQHQHTDQWSGDDYLKYPGLRELAKFSHDTVLYALRQAGHTDEGIKSLNVLEVGCGAGAVTQLLSGSFASVHAIDVSPSMLATVSSELPPRKYPNVTYSQHTLSKTSAEEFQSGELVPSPTKQDPGRQIKLPRGQWDVAVVNLVLHHVDDVPGFMAGLRDLLVEGGMVVFTEFTNLPLQRTETKEGSVNAPEHYHDIYTEKTIAKLLLLHGWKDLYTEVRGKMKIWRNDQFHNVDCLIARGTKSSKSG